MKPHRLQPNARHRAHGPASHLTDDGLTGGPSHARRAWSKPRVIHRETLEAVAADCTIPGGKSDPTCTVGFS